MDEMKLLIIGSDEVWSLERHYRTYLSLHAGVKIDFCPVQSIFYREYNKSLLHKVLFRARLSTLAKRLDDTARNHVLESKPDIIWVFKGMELQPSFFEWVTAARRRANGARVNRFPCRVRAHVRTALLTNVYCAAPFRPA